MSLSLAFFSEQWFGNSDKFFIYPLVYSLIICYNIPSYKQVHRNETAREKELWQDNVNPATSKESESRQRRVAAYKDEPESSENTRIAETVGGNRRTRPQTRRSPAKTAGIVLAIGKVLLDYIRSIRHHMRRMVEMEPVKAYKRKRSR